MPRNERQKLLTVHPWQAAAIAAVLYFSSGATSFALRLAVTGPEQVLSDQAVGACDASDLPDAPARAFRNDAGAIVLFAPNYVNRALVGPDLRHLTKDCGIRFKAGGSAEPDRLDDRSWLHGFHTDDGRQIFAFASASFIPYRHGMACAAGAKRTDCWLNGIAALRSEDGGRSFRYLGEPPRQIAFPPPKPYRADIPDPAGFVSTTNIVRWRGSLFTILWRRAEASEGRSRNCLARAPAGDLLNWQIWSGQRFTPATAFKDGGWAAVTEDCAPIGSGLPAIRGVVLQSVSETFIAVFQYRGKPPEAAPGFYYATSTDLINWSAPALLLATDLSPGSAAGWAAYPSIIDETSPDRNFGTIGATANLLFVRIHPPAPGRATTSRQLVAVPLRTEND